MINLIASTVIFIHPYVYSIPEPYCAPTYYILRSTILTEPNKIDKIHSGHPKIQKAWRWFKHNILRCHYFIEQE